MRSQKLPFCAVCSCEPPRLTCATLLVRFLPVDNTPLKEGELWQHIGSFQRIPTL